MNIPSDLKYTQADEWVKVEGDVAIIGVTDYAQDALSDVVYFEAIVSVGDSLSAGSQIGTLESVKAAADVNTPVSGTVIAVNEELPNSPETVNQDPYGKAWMIKLELANSSEINKLLDAAAYSQFLETRSH
jgi:glycine cleavage system H protein